MGLPSTVFEASTSLMNAEGVGIGPLVTQKFIGLLVIVLFLRVFPPESPKVIPTWRLFDATLSTRVLL